MGKETLKEIITLLNSKDIIYEHFNHEPVPKDSIGASKVRGLSPDSGAKALILKGKSGNFYQTILSGHLRLDIKKLKILTSEKSLSLAHPHEVLKLTDCIIGTIPPLGILWGIPVYIDNLILKKEEVVFSSGTATDTIKINPKQLQEVNKAIISNISKEV